MKKRLFFESRSVALRGGGTLTLSLLGGNPLNWPVADRELFFDLVDRMTRYEELSARESRAELDALRDAALSSSPVRPEREKP